MISSEGQEPLVQGQSSRRLALLRSLVALDTLRREVEAHMQPIIVSVVGCHLVRVEQEILADTRAVSWVANEQRANISQLAVGAIS
jgi:hypothetical protein